MGRNFGIKYVRRLANRRFREREGRFLAEGVRFVEEALRSGWTVEMVIYCPLLTSSERGCALLREAREAGVTLQEVPDSLLVELADTETPQGVIAVIRRPVVDLAAAIESGKNSFLVLVDGVRDPGNLGTIIRAADAFGAGGVVLLKGTVDLYNPKTLRSTMGSLFHLPVVMAERAEAIDRLIKAGFRLIVGVPGGIVPLYDADLDGQVVLVVGNEASGAGTDVLELADGVVTIPMPGRAESLNVAVAAGIMMYELVRRRTGR